MSELAKLVDCTKRLLKQQGFTYKTVAQSLGLSEPSVKRMFATRRLTVERLIDIGNLLGFTLAELAQEAAISEGRVHSLGEAQECELISDPKLLLVCVCVLNQWTAADITRVYALTEADVISYLVRLDRLRLIDLLPGNRVRLNVARDFDWLPDGPIRGFFRLNGMGDFLGGGFAEDGETFVFANGMLTEAAAAKMQSELGRLRRRFAELHEESLSAPLEKRRGLGLLLAMREWELAAFTALRRAGQG